MILILLVICGYGIAAPVRTSLCCCGCLEEPCPVVGASCPPPNLPCRLETSEETVYCSGLKPTLIKLGVSELQRLWEMAVVERNESSPVLEERNAPGFTPFVSETGRPYKITNFERPPPEILETELTNQDVVFRGLNATTEIRFSPPKKIVSTEKLKADSLEKMQTILAELQEMIASVKELMAAEGIVTSKLNSSTAAIEKPPIEQEKITLPPDADNITEEEERRAIDDVIRRMKGTFRKVTKEGTPPVNELVDSSVSTSVIDVQSISMKPIRPKRAARKNAGNCNDEQLRSIIDENITRDAKSSKRQIQKAAEKEFGGTFNVICSPCEFSFVISSQKYCEGFKEQVACFVFLQPPTAVKKL